MPAEFSIRQKAMNPIYTIKPAVMKAFLAARPESWSLVLAKYKKDYKILTGKTISLDHEQTGQLMAAAGADERGMWTSKYSKLPAEKYLVMRAFQDGFLMGKTSEGLLKDLAIAETFFSLLD